MAEITDNSKLYYCDYSCQPVRLEELHEGNKEQVSVNVTCSKTEDHHIQLYLQAKDEQFIDIPQPWVTFNYSTGGFNFTVQGKEFGRTSVIFNQTSGRDDFQYNVGVIRPSNMVLDIIFAVVLATMLVFINTGFGCKIKIDMVKAILKKPVAPSLGFCCQFLIMAPLSFGIARLMQLDNVSGLGLLTIGSCPGGGGSNVFAILMDADLDLSITMTFISTLAALGMTPFWIWALGRFFTDGETKLGIPVTNVFASLAIVVIPVLLGVLMANLKQTWASNFSKILKPFIICTGLVFVVFGTYVYWYAFIRVTWRTAVACVITPLLGYIIGLIVALIFRQDRPRAITISLETGFQNMALALMMLRISLPLPEADISGVIPICYMFLSAGLGAVAVIMRYVKKLCEERMFKKTKTFEVNDTQLDNCVGGSDEKYIYNVRRP